MKKVILLIVICMCFAFAKAQKVDILDKNKKVIKTVDEKHLDKEIVELGLQAKYTARWIEGQAVECRIDWERIKFDAI
ncbi:hypothetical protein AB832_05560 [Flavobacteriaceae bacterium (ex Bugula neritina AB1)]|nr:hypothetical protein AB832_05560 [Flavobacteriaceae bacterium (ex Bugula neritina AB1)]